MTYSGMQPVGTPQKRTYRAEGAGTNALTRGYGVIQGTADDQALYPTGAGQRCLGVVLETVSVDNDPVSIARRGEVIAISGQASLAAGTTVKMDASGKFVDADGADNERAGIALSSASADGDEFMLDLNPAGQRS